MSSVFVLHMPQRGGAANVGQCFQPAWAGGRKGEKGCGSRALAEMVSVSRPQNLHRKTKLFETVVQRRLARRESKFSVCTQPQSGRCGSVANPQALEARLEAAHKFQCLTLTTTVVLPQ